MTTPFETRDLVLRLRAGDDAARGELLQRFLGPLRAALPRLIGPAYRRLLLDSDDAVQDAMLAAVRGIDGFEYRGKGSFLAWMLCCAENEIRQRLRAADRQKRRGVEERLDRTGVEQPAAASSADPVRQASQEELAARLRQVLDELPAQEREAILLRRYLGLSTRDVQLELGLPTEGAARALLSRAQARLAGLVARRGKTDGGSTEGSPG